MFDLTSSKLLLLGIVALVVVGPKDLPALLRTIGKYVGVIKRHANEFRAQFEEAMRDSEIDQLKKDVEKIGQDAEASMRDAERTVEAQIAASREEVEKAVDTAAVDTADAAAPVAPVTESLPAPAGDAQPAAIAQTPEPHKSEA